MLGIKMAVSWMAAYVKLPLPERFCSYTYGLLTIGIV